MVKDSYYIANAIRNRILSAIGVDELLNSHSKSIRINAKLNEDPAMAPWVGVYTSRDATRPHTTAKGWLQSVIVHIVIQSSNFNGDVDECMKTLGQLEASIKDSITVDTSLGGVIDTITEIDTDYTTAEQSNDNTYFQAAVMTVTAQVRSNARR